MYNKNYSAGPSSIVSDPLAPSPGLKKSIWNWQTSISGDRGDQIGRSLAHWLIVYFWAFFLNYESSPHFLASIFHS
jgi:hypothetical protein